MSMGCVDRLEALGAWLDGEASQDEVVELERHVQVCSGCRDASRMLADLGSSVARQPGLAPPVDFAARTARAVLPGRGPVWATLRSLWPEALGHLVERQGKAGPAQVVLLFGLPALVLGLLNPLLPAWFLRIAAVCLLVGLPLHHWQGRVARLGSLQRGRALEEILLAGMSRAQLLDGLALGGLGRLAWAGLGFAPVLALVDGRAGLLWLPALLGLAWLGSYPAASWTLGGAWQPGALFGLGWLALPVTPGFGLIVAAVSAVSSRGMALRMLERKPVRRAPGSRNRLLLSHSDNPIVMRESARRAACIPGGMAGVVVRNLPLVLLSAVAAYTLGHNPDSPPAWAFLGLATFAVVARAALRTLGAVLHEREQGTWEPLLQAGVGAREFVAGWLRVSVGEALLSLLAVWALALPAAALSLGLDSLQVGFPVLELVTLPGVAALLGLALSARSRNLGEARSSLLAWGFGLPLAALALVAADVQFRWLGSSYLLAVACVAGATTLWSARTLRHNLGLSLASVPPPGLISRLSVCSGCCGAALALVSQSWPELPDVTWDTLLALLLGYGLGWLTGRALGWLVAPALRFPGSTRLQAWVITMAWGTLCGLTLGGLRMVLTWLEWPDASGHWSYEQLALAVAAAVIPAALLGLRTEAPGSSPGRLGLALALSGARVAVAFGLLAAFVAWQLYLPAPDVEPILAEVRARRQASRQLPPAAARLEKLLRGDWPAGSGVAYLDPERLRLQGRVAEVAEVIRRGQFPASDPALPLAMDPGLLQGVASALAELYRKEHEIDYLLLAVEWSARGRQLGYAYRALEELRLALGNGRWSEAQLRMLLARTDGLAEQPLGPVCDEMFASDLASLQQQRSYYPDRPDFYWSHQAAAMKRVYMGIRPLCHALVKPALIESRQASILAGCGPHARAESELSDYAARVGQEREARATLRALRADAQLQLERR